MSVIETLCSQNQLLEGAINRFHGDKMKVLHWTLSELDKLVPTELNNRNKCSMWIDSNGIISDRDNGYYSGRGPSTPLLNLFFNDVLEYNGERYLAHDFKSTKFNTDISIAHSDTKNLKKMFARLHRGFLVGRFTFVKRGGYVRLSIED